VAAKTALSLAAGDVVVVDTPEGSAAAIVQDVADHDTAMASERTCEVVRRANLNDLKTIREHRKKEADAIRICRQEVKKYNLPMKLVDAAYSLDGGGITFAFTADGRVDFRELVKTLSKVFQRSIRLHQIGARDESRQRGGYGICGREQCCVKFQGDLPSISSEMAKIQQIAHRGSERISGICGRLMCCLAYEADQYRQMLENFPKPGETVNYRGKDATVRDINATSGEIKVELPDASIVSINKNDLK